VMVRRGRSVQGMTRLGGAVAPTIVAFACLAAFTLAVPGAAQEPAPATAGRLALNFTGPTAILLGAAAVYWANASGGQPPYQFTWTVNGSVVRSNITSNGSSEYFSLRPVADAIYFVAVNVTDHGANSSASEMYLRVTGPSPLSIVLRVLATSENGAVTLHAAVAGGRTPYGYRWTGPGATSGWSASANYTTSPLGNGAYPVSVAVRDADGYGGSASVTIQSHVVASAGPPPWYVWLAGGIAGGLGGTLLALYIVRRRRAA
jgi:hypothetical protein